MLTAELVAPFFALLYLGHLARLDPLALTALPPLDFLVEAGAAGSVVAAFLAYLFLFAAYELVALITLRAVAALSRRDMEELRQGLSRGRDPRGLGVLIWITLLGTPLAVAVLLASGARDAPRLLFVASLLLATAAQTLRPFTIGDLWRACRHLDADLRTLTRPGDPVDEPPAAPPSAVPDQPSPSIIAGGSRDWLAVSDRRSH